MRKSCLLLSYAASIAALAAEPTLTVDAGRPSGKVSPRLYGLMTEEINHCYDGGLYAELIRNRAFLDDPNSPAHWSVVGENAAAARLALDSANPCNDKLTASLRVTVANASARHPAGVANAGFWGIPVQPHTRYRATLLARAEPGFSGPVTVSIVSEDGRVVYASEKLSGLTPQWGRFQTTLKTGRAKPTAKASFRITLDQPGTVWLGLVSLFPPTWNDRPNGLRKDLMQMLVDLKPKFLRFPGGNYLEGETIETRFQWKNTIGPIEERHGHPCPWGYRSTDGLGLLEFLEWCEDMQAEPVLAVYAGYSLRGDHVKAGPGLEPFVQEALEEIEYVVGDNSTPWGARRARDGHAAPFRLNYVEIGNEDGFDKAKSYDGRFAQFYDAIKAKFPQLKLISTVSNDELRIRKADMVDLHFYSSTDEFIRMSRNYGANFRSQRPGDFRRGVGRARRFGSQALGSTRKETAAHPLDEGRDRRRRVHGGDGAKLRHHLDAMLRSPVGKCESWRVAMATRSDWFRRALRLRLPQLLRHPDVQPESRRRNPAGSVDRYLCPRLCHPRQQDRRDLPQARQPPAKPAEPPAGH